MMGLCMTAETRLCYVLCLDRQHVWAERTFMASHIYLPTIFIAMVLSHFIEQ